MNMIQQSIENQFKKHFKEKYEKQIQSQINLSNKQSVVILCSGCYCPPHLGHYFMMQEAVIQLQKKYNYNVLLGIYSVANDQYMQSKVKDFQMDFDQRKQELELIIQENQASSKTSQKILVDDFEKNKRFIDYPELCLLYKNCLNQLNVKLIYCVGSDLLKYQIHKQFKQFADLLIIFEREQMKVEQNIANKDDIIVLQNQETTSISSTQIRSIFDKFDNQ
ncbi:cytidylyltransferase (macronuclear) [Tetrahymena thermophila SB210]|uniref:Cytidylyltransferase n=1 Tax=Tetrahymena thermophila (strain SB210) TaxID=312017 RepID=Q22RU1_TETTS|nr:cytidylyltransferase [Tetrahymena thermophila SB210]EAR88031.1 cytidylyltransferase [Tetrahymena thermophila SB210]|eukprot:XP_001008276.1 cytidylyltransferase [Tetrahymena thermophila SB210]